MGLTRITSDGITDGTVVNADINASAAIAGTKIDPNFGTQDVTSRYVYANDIFLGDVSPELRFTDSDNNPDYRIRLNSGILDFYDITNTTSRMSIQADGHIDIAGNLDVGAGLDVTGAITGTGDMTIDTNTLHVDSSNNRVGIGTTSPSDDLEVASAGHTGILIQSNRTTATDNIGALDFRSSSTDVARIQSLVDGTIKFRNTSALTERMRIDSSGRVLIGTTTAGHSDLDDLTISSSGNTGITIRSGTSNLGVLGFADGTSGNTQYRGVIQYSHSSDFMQFNTADAERMRIDSSGNVLIGTTAARVESNGFAAPLQVEGTGTATSSVIIARNSNNASSSNLIFQKSRGTSVGSNTVIQNNDAVGTIIFEGSDGTNTDSLASIIGACDATPGTNDVPGRLVFSTTADGAASPTERMRINSAGKIGINYSGNPPSEDVMVCTAGQASPAGLSLSHLSGGNRYGARLSTISGTNSGVIFSTLFNSGYEERMRIDSSGDVGIGNNSPSCRLAIKDVAEHTAYASVTPSVTESMLQLYNNPPNETANDHATIQFGVNGGSHNRVNAISAVAESAGNRKLAFTFCTDEAGSRTEKMRITGDGNVGIGTTSPSQKLDVSGGIKATTDITLASTTAGQSIIVTKNGTQAVKLGHIGTGNEGLLVLKENGTDTIKFNGATGGTSYINAGNVGIKTTSPTGTLDVHDGTFVLSKPSTNSSSRNWRFLPDNIAAGNLGLQVSTAAGGSTFQNVLEVDKTGTIFTAQNGTAFSWPSNPGHVWYADGEARSTTANGVHYRINRMNGDGHAVQFYRGQTNMVGFISITSSSTGYGSGSSDERTKKNIEVWNEDILSKFKALSPKTFNFNWEEDGTTKHKGYIAQNELDKFPEAYPKNNLSDSGDEFYTFVPTDMTVYLMKGLKEAAEKIETLEAKVAALETK